MNVFYDDRLRKKTEKRIFYENNLEFSESESEGSGDSSYDASENVPGIKGNIKELKKLTRLLKIWENRGPIHLYSAPGDGAFTITFRNYKMLKYNELDELFKQCGPYLSMRELDDNYVRVRYEKEDEIRKCYNALKKDENHEVTVLLDEDEYYLMQQKKKRMRALLRNTPHADRTLGSKDHVDNDAFKKALEEEGKIAFSFQRSNSDPSTKKCNYKKENFQEPTNLVGFWNGHVVVKPEVPFVNKYLHPACHTNGNSDRSNELAFKANQFESDKSANTTNCESPLLMGYKCQTSNSFTMIMDGSCNNEKDTDSRTLYHDTGNKSTGRASSQALLSGSDSMEEVDMSLGFATPLKPGEYKKYRKISNTYDLVNSRKNDGFQPRPFKNTIKDSFEFSVASYSTSESDSVFKFSLENCAEKGSYNFKPRTTEDLQKCLTVVKSFFSKNQETYKDSEKHCNSDHSACGIDLEQVKPLKSIVGRKVYSSLENSIDKRKLGNEYFENMPPLISIFDLYAMWLRKSVFQMI